MTKKKPRKLIRFATSTVLMLALAAGFQMAQADARTLNFATPRPPTERPTNDVLRWWVDEVNARTGGTIEIRVHWLQSLVAFRDAARGIQSGVADIGDVTPEYTAARNPLWAITQTETGSGDNYIATEAWRRATKGFTPLEEESARIGLRPIGYYSSGVRVNISTTRPYLTPDDFKGDKVRMTPRAISARTNSKWNVTPVNITFTDIYSALERGTIDGAQSYLYVIAPYKHNEVAKYVVNTTIGQSLIPVMMNARVWESLTDKEREVFLELEPLFSEKMTKAGLEEAEQSIQLLQNHPRYPVEYYTLNESQRDAWERDMAPAIQEYIDDIAKRNPAAHELHDRLMTHLAEVEREVQEHGYPWQRKQSLEASE